MPPRLYSLKQAGEILGASMTKMYELVGSGRIEAVKFGGATKIRHETLERLVDSLPKATITTQPRHPAKAHPKSGWRGRKADDARPKSG
jgi:excisionase family DNA binding protein